MRLHVFIPYVFVHLKLIDYSAAHLKSPATTVRTLVHRFFPSGSPGDVQSAASSDTGSRLPTPGVDDDIWQGIPKALWPDVQELAQCVADAEHAEALLMNDIADPPVSVPAGQLVRVLLLPQTYTFHCRCSTLAVLFGRSDQ